MVFPWVGLFEQIRLADVFVHLDDVQLPQGRSFVTRVQLKTARGLQWLTVPVRRAGRQLIKDVQMDDAQPWRQKHLAALRHAYARSPHADEMLAVASRVYELETSSLCEFNIAAIREIGDHFGSAPQFVLSSTLATTSAGTEKLVDIAVRLGATRYVTGLGALDYLDYDLFERRGIRVEYMQYERAPYPQLHGPFTASVTALDCIANCGRHGARYAHSESRYWKEVVSR